MNTSKQKEISRQFKTIKLIQLLVLIFMEGLFFIAMYVHPSLKNSLYSNPPLFTLCAITWFLMIFSFVCLYFDFSVIKKMTGHSYELGKAAYLDSMTGIPNRYSCDQFLKTCCSEDVLASLGCGIVTISSLARINSKYGHDTGDMIIRDFCRILDRVGSDYGFVGRNSGNEYLIFLEFCSKEKMEQFFSVLNMQTDSYNKEHPDKPIELTYAYVLNEDLHSKGFANLITAAYQKLHDLTDL